MADLGSIIVKLVADAAGYKVGLDKADAHTATFEKQTTNRFANIGNMFIKMFGGAMLVRQLAMMVAQMDEVNGALKKMKAQAQYMFEETIRPGLPYIIDGIETIGTIARGLIGVFDAVGTSIGVLMSNIVTQVTAIGTLIKSGLFKKSSWKEFDATMKSLAADTENEFSAMWDRIQKNYEKSGKATPKKKEEPLTKELIKQRDLLIKYRTEMHGVERSMVNSVRDVTSEIGDMWGGLFASINNDLKTFSEWAQRIEGYTDSLAYTMAAALNGMQVSFKDWAQSVIIDIERVIIKMMILRTISAALGMLGAGGKALQIMWNNAVGLPLSSPRGGGERDGGGRESSTIVINEASHLVTVRRINGAYAKAPLGEQARLAQAVARGRVANLRR